MSELTVRYNIPVTSPTRTLGDLAPLLTPRALGSCANEVIRRGLIGPADLEALV